ncbi:MAG: hypothetical protein DSZ23_05170 [Thermodesulfatator sp.]|nr:MAG: hypothetical protein DSZ23_05170 [Thermodesulfatator sp.]
MHRGKKRILYTVITRCLWNLLSCAQSLNKKSWFWVGTGNISDSLVLLAVSLPAGENTFYSTFFTE